MKIPELRLKAARASLERVMWGGREDFSILRIDATGGSKSNLGVSGLAGEVISLEGRFDEEEDAGASADIF